MIFLKYKQPKAEYVQFQRLLFGLIVLAGVLFQMLEFVYLFITLSAVSFLTTINYSPTTLLFKFLSFIIQRPLFVTAPQYARSYVTYRLAEIFEDIMRIAAGGLIVYLHGTTPLAAWMLGSFMGTAMLVSGFFGFCFSSLVYIGYQHILKKLGLS